MCAHPASSLFPDFIRSRDVEALNRLLNHPRIRPHMGGEGILDGSPLLENGFLLLSDTGGMLFHGADGIMEGHYLFTRPSYDLALGMVHACMLEAARRCLWGRVPVQNRAAALFTRRLGFEYLGVRAAPFPAHIFAKGRRPFPSLETFWER